ncbi:MAG TPA: hypothetical protein VE978_24660 [Chitinophagales bacterium]|nr:hypothetical protein [Chitinophagales bacterium]
MKNNFLEFVQKFRDLFALLFAIVGLGETLYKFVNEKITSYIGISLLLIAVLIFFINRFIKRKRPPVPLLLGKESAGIIRGLLPFGKGDILLGRNEEKSKAIAIINNLEFKFGFITGEAGSGKTSFIRAILIDTILNTGKIPIYVPRIKNDPIDSIKNEIQKEFNIDHDDKSLINIIKLIRKENKKIILIIDQFEEFFISFKTFEQRQIFIDELGKLLKDSNLQIGILLSLRKEFVEDLLDFSKIIAQPTDNRYCLRLKNWSILTARQILKEVISSGELSFTDELSDALISDLATSGLVRPVEFQLVAKTLQEKDIQTEADYKLLGKATGILTSFLEEIIARTTTKNVSLEIHASKLLLRMLCDDVNDTKKPIGLLIPEIVLQVKNNIEHSEIKGFIVSDTELDELIEIIINKFKSEFILINEDELHLNLVHDYLVKPIREATSGMETTEEKANQLLRRYIQEQKTFSTVSLSWTKYRYIKKFASGELLLQIDARQILKQTKQRINLVILSAVGLAVFIFSFLLPTGIYYKSKIIYASPNGIFYSEASSYPKVYLLESDSSYYWIADSINVKRINKQVSPFPYSNALSGDGNWIAGENNESYILCNIHSNNEFYETPKDTSHYLDFMVTKEFSPLNSLFVLVKNNGQVLLLSISENKILKIDTDKIPLDLIYHSPIGNIKYGPEKLKNIYITFSAYQKFIQFSLEFKDSLKRDARIVHNLLYQYDPSSNHIKRVNFDDPRYDFYKYEWIISDDEKEMYLYSDSSILIYDFVSNSTSKLDLALDRNEAIESVKLKGVKTQYLLVETNRSVYFVMESKPNYSVRLLSFSSNKDSIMDENHWQVSSDTDYIVVKESTHYKVFKVSLLETEKISVLKLDSNIDKMRQNWNDVESLSPNHKFFLLENAAGEYLSFAIDSLNIKYFNKYYDDILDARCYWSEDSKYLYVFNYRDIYFGPVDNKVGRIDFKDRLKGRIEHIATDNWGKSLYILTTQQIVSVKRIFFLFGLPIFTFKWPVIYDRTGFITG